MSKRMGMMLLALALFPAQANAQPPAAAPPEHVPIGPEKISLEELRKLGRPDLLSNVDPALLEALSKRPEFQRLAEDIRRQQAGSGDSGGWLKEFQPLINKFAPQTGRRLANANHNPSTGPASPDRGNPPPRLSPDNPPEANAGTTAPSPNGDGSAFRQAGRPSLGDWPRATASQEPEPEQSEAEKAFARWLKSQAPALQRMAGPITSSAAFQDALRKWATASAVPAQGGVGATPGLIERQVSRLMKTAAQSRVWSKIRFPDLRMSRLRLGRMPPAGGGLRWQLPSLPMPSFTASRPPVEETSGSTVGIWLGLLLAMGLVAWLIYRRASTVGSQETRWVLGDWPVAPHEVQSPQDLVRDFEYLSLLRLGLASRAWNHRHIADRLSDNAETTAEKNQAAAHLAALYERVRYAPGAHSLESEDLNAVRRELALLAGVSTS